MERVHIKLSDSVPRTIKMLNIKARLCTPYNKSRVCPNSPSILDNIQITISFFDDSKVRFDSPHGRGAIGTSTDHKPIQNRLSKNYN